MLRERIFWETKDLDVGAHWRFQHQNALWTAMNVDYESFIEEMQTLCDEGYFDAVKDGKVTHYIVMKKP